MSYKRFAAMILTSPSKTGSGSTIFAGSATVILVTLFLARSQTTVQDVSWMKAMIPHHSIAILTSERAELSDPRVQELAQEIIEAQRREISGMNALIEDLEDD